MLNNGSFEKVPWYA